VRPTYAQVDLSAIAFNLKRIAEKVAPARIMAVVKANAYGHGALEVARVALETGASYLAVALLEEGIELREQGIKAPILVFGGAFPDEMGEFLQHDLDVTVYSERQIKALSQEARRLGKRARVHVKVDTGMGRVGVAWQEAVPFAQRIVRNPYLYLVGLYTHFATSDMKDKSFACTQWERFSRVIQELEDSGVQVPIKHAANSGAILDLPETYLDMVRPGIMIYGYYPSAETTESVPLRPAMTLKSRVIQVKEVPEGTGISYGHTYVTPRATRIATIPVGYADGYNRLLSNQGEVLIRGRKYRVVGRVCMDQIMADVGLDSDVQVGDEVVLFGRQGDQEVSVYDICRKLHTIPYEVCCWVSARVPRVYVGKSR